MSIVDNFLPDYRGLVYVETGTCKGDGLQFALDAGFAKKIFW
jgi:hypothetical protein